nr:hypothetical protein [Tanacetum cinerariifolium]
EKSDGFYPSNQSKYLIIINALFLPMTLSHQSGFISYQNSPGIPLVFQNPFGADGNLPSRQSVPASGVPAGSLPTSSVPAGGVLAGSIVSAEFGVPAASESVHAVFTNDPTSTSLLPPGHSLGSCEHTTRFPSPNDLG